MRNQAEINQKISKSLKGRGHSDVEKICEECQESFIVKWHKRTQRFCSNRCSSIYKQRVYKDRYKSAMKKAYSTVEARKRLRDIGRKGGFGTKGITKGGTRYESLFEKEVFEYLEENKIPFEPHKPIPNSAKISDIYLIEKDIWVELDGIDREKNKHWLGKDYEYWLEKLKLYDDLGLKYLVIKTSELWKEYL